MAAWKTPSTHSKIDDRLPIAGTVPDVGQGDPKTVRDSAPSYISGDI